MYNSSVHRVNKLYEAQTIFNKDLSHLMYIVQFCLSWRQEVKRTVSKSLSQLAAMGWGSARVKCETKQMFLLRVRRGDLS